MSKLAGKVAVATGASKGIGAALAAEGAFVVVNYASSKEGAGKVANAITGEGGKAVAIAADVSEAAGARGLIEAAIEQYGKLDIAVNNAGRYALAPIEKFTEEDVHKHFALSVLGVLLVTQAALKPATSPW